VKRALDRAGFYENPNKREFDTKMKDR
jgi:hypothetical protein